MQGCRQHQQLLKVSVSFPEEPSLYFSSHPSRRRQTNAQQLISKYHDEVWDLVSDPLCHAYVCGEAAMGEEVKAEVRT